MRNKIAVVLFNLGGPDSLNSVKKFLFNLFYDKSIINLPNPLRWIIAKIISSTREKTAIEIYQKIGGSSPILSITKKQAIKLQEELNKNIENEYKVFISMRYWHPFANDVIKEIEQFSADRVVLLPLYPQFSTTTTNSSFKEFKSLYKKPTKISCCYFYNKNFIKAHVDLIKSSLKDLKGKYRILFSAHGLPEKIIRSGDPYQWQVEETVKYIVKNLQEDVDYIVCYQSKVGPLKWIGPSTEEEIERAIQDEVSIVIVPIAFVSDHSETLMELDIEYKELFEKKSKLSYIRVPALNDNDNFIKSLVDQVDLAMNDSKQERRCPESFCKCYKDS